MNFILLIVKVYLTSQVHGISGGHEINIEDAPYQVNYGDDCGGALLDTIWVLTSAHCGNDTDFVRVGNRDRLGGLKVKIESHFVHPQYQKRHSFDFDVQLLKLYIPLRFTNKVAAIKINDGEFGEYVTISGWGYPKEKTDFSRYLHQVTLRIVPKEHCQDVENQWYNHTLTRRMFCAGGGYQDACQGDSGGAAVSSDTLLGISSFGYGCGRHIPGVYINVTEKHIRAWIYSLTGL